MMKAPTFTQYQDGRVTVDEFPADMAVTPEFLRYADRSFVRRAGFREFVIRCDNLVALYRLEKRDKPADVFLCRRVRMGVP